MPFLTANELSLYYEIHGPEDAFPVVLINGLLMDTTGWALQVPAFADRFQVIVYDCRGQGRSDAPAGPYTPAQHAADLVGLLDALGVARAHLVGLSNGGVIAMYVAAEHPDRVSRLVVADTFACADAQMRAVLDAWLAALEAGGPVLRFDVATPWVWSRGLLAAHGDVLDALREKAAKARVDAVRHLITGAKGVDLRHRLSRIQAPTLVMVGEEDVLTPVWRARELVGAIPDATLVVVGGAGHALTIERPQVFNGVAREFLSEE